MRSLPMQSSHSYRQNYLWNRTSPQLGSCTVNYISIPIPFIIIKKHILMKLWHDIFWMNCSRLCKCYGLKKDNSFALGLFVYPILTEYFRCFQKGKLCWDLLQLCVVKSSECFVEITVIYFLKIAEVFKMKKNREQ